MHHLDRATDMIYQYAGLATASCSHSSSLTHSTLHLPWNQNAQPPRPPYQQSRSSCHREPRTSCYACHIKDSACTNFQPVQKYSENVDVDGEYGRRGKYMEVHNCVLFGASGLHIGAAVASVCPTALPGPKTTQRPNCLWIA